MKEKDRRNRRNKTRSDVARARVNVNRIMNRSEPEGTARLNVIRLNVIRGTEDG